MVFLAGSFGHPCWSVLKMEIESCVEYIVVSSLSYIGLHPLGYEYEAALIATIIPALTIRQQPA
jgi:hypothetical protein